MRPLLPLVLLLTAAPAAAETVVVVEPLTLQRTLALAAAQAPDVVVANARLAVARARQERTEAARWPTVGLSSSFSPGAQVTLPLLAQDEAALCSAGNLACSVGAAPVGSARAVVSVEARWRLWDFGARDAAVEASARSVRVAEAQRAAERARAAATAAHLWITVVADDELVVVRERLAADRARQAEIVKGLVELGGAAPIDVLPAVVSAEAAALDVEVARADARADRAALAAALGLDTVELVSGSLALRPRPAGEDRHPDVLAALAAVHGAEADVVRAERDLLPTVDGSAQISTSALALTKPDANLTPAVGIGVALAWPIFDAPAARALNEARAAKDVAVATLTAVIVDVRAARARAALTFEAQGRIATRAAQLVNSARAALHAVEERIAAGAGRVADLLDAQTAVAQAEVTLVQARAAVARAAVDVALAGGVVDDTALAAE